MSRKVRTVTCPSTGAPLRSAIAVSGGSVPRTRRDAALPGGSLNVLTGTGNHASADAPYGLQDGTFSMR